jgi:osmotically-inducible protein OsmY
MKTKLLLILGLIALPIATTIALERNTNINTPGGIQNKIDNIADSIKKNPALTAKVIAKLKADPILKKYFSLKGYLITVTSYMNGLVKLSGRVFKEEDKLRATTITKEVEGVTNVINNLSVEVIS